MKKIKLKMLFLTHKTYNHLKQSSIKYLLFLIGIILLIYTEVQSNSNPLISVVGLSFLCIGLYMISKGIGKKPDYDPYAVQSDEEE